MTTNAVREDGRPAGDATLRRSWLAGYRHGRREARHLRAREAQRWLHRTNPKKTDGALLEEYKALRGEITTCMGTQASVLAFGAAALSLVFAAGAQAEAEARTMLFLLLAPLLCYLIASVWLAEFLRMMRAGTFLMYLEKRLDDEFGIGALTWESTMHYRRAVGGMRLVLIDPDRVRAVAITTLFMALASTSIALGWGGAAPWQKALAITASTLFVVFALYLGGLQAKHVGELLRPLTLGAHGRQVTHLQEVLQKEGAYAARVDGEFGEQTAKAVRSFQRKHNLVPDAVVGPITQRFVEAAVDEDGLVFRLASKRTPRKPRASV